jgi:hypothetical protein
MTKALLLFLTGAVLLTISLTYPVAHPLVGVLVGSVLVGIGIASLLCRKPAEPVERDEHERGV